MNYCEFHLGDYAKAAGHLSMLEHGAYFGLLRKCYSSEKPLPPDVQDVLRLVGARSEDEKAATEVVLREFFVLREDGFHQPRCDEEIARYRAKQEKARRSANARWSGSKTHSAGSASVAYWQSDGNANASPNAMRSHSGGSALQTPDTSNQSSVPIGTGTAGAVPPPLNSAPPMTEREIAETHVKVAAGLPQTAAERTREEKAALWRGAKACLWLDAGLPTAKGGEIIGKHARDYPDGDVLTSAIVALCRDRPAGPVAWLKRALQLRAGEASKTNKQGRLEAANDKVGEGFLSGDPDAPMHMTTLEIANDAVGAAFLAGANTL